MPHYPRHLVGFEYQGFQRYFLTFSTYERNRYFVDTERVSLVGEQILRASAEKQFAVIAYCYMPDHLHLLIEGIREDADMKDFVTTVIKYIIENPVRAGLVSDARDYPFWGSQMYSREELLEHISEPAQAGPYDRTG